MHSVPRQCRVQYLRRARLRFDDHPFPWAGRNLRPWQHWPVGEKAEGMAIVSRFRCFALALYGPHAAGDVVNQDERAMLAELAEKAASVFMKLDHDQLCQRIAAG
jgi:hypothetical protein